MSGGIQVFPFYIICDVSKSMGGERIDSVNSGLPFIHREIISDPVVSEKARLGVISFSTEARVELSLSKLADVREMPVLHAGGQTNFATAFQLAAETIRIDVERLKEEGFSVLRPCVYFITDGRPGDGWKKARDQWVDKSVNKYAPNVICFGVADADEETLKRLTTRFTFMANRGTSAANALREVMRSITASVVSTTRGSEAQLAIPATGENFRVLDKDIKEEQTGK
jgi:uncharacterized protein YegL